MTELTAAQQRQQSFSVLFALMAEKPKTEIEQEALDDKALVELARVVKADYANNFSKAADALVSKQSDRSRFVQC